DAMLADRAAEMRKMEIALARLADATIAISAEEKAALLDMVPADAVEVLPNVFEAPADLPPGPFGRRNVMFLGGFWHKPNGDAVKWFVNEIWPSIVARVPSCRFLIAGSNPGPDILALQAVPGVEVLGYVPDLKPVFDAARVCVAPLRYGAGAK